MLQHYQLAFFKVKESVLRIAGIIDEVPRYTRSVLREGR